MDGNPNQDKDQSRFMSKSFGGTTSPLLRDLNFQRRQVSSVSKITYRGYLLKRSNQPYIEVLDERNHPIVTDQDAFPELPLMHGKFSTQSLENRLVDDLRQQTNDTNRTTKPTDLAVVKPLNRSQQGLDFAAVFFGFPVADKQKVEGDVVDQQTSPHLHQHATPMAVFSAHSASKPIKFSNRSRKEKYNENTQKMSFQEALHRRHSDPFMNTHGSDTDEDDGYYQTNAQPDDFVDPRDGHIWRAKYCVLDDRILYFYRNMTDGECAEAVRERSEDTSVQSGTFNARSKRTSNIGDLSRSPMARSYLHHLGANDSRDGLSYMWEKRVVLDCVGAVRSAEQEYGPHSFELQGIDHNGGSSHLANSLVLRAHDHMSMNEWIFQFHRSLASFVRNFMDAFGPSGTYTDFPVPTIATAVDQTVGSEDMIQQILPRSPRMTHSAQVTTSLSHGHGRITGHRRKDSIEKASSSIEASPLSLPSTPNDHDSFGFVSRTSKPTPSIANLWHQSPSHSPHFQLLSPSPTEQIRPIFPHYELSPMESMKNKHSGKTTPNIPTNTVTRYVPPSQRNREDGPKQRGLLSLREREATDNDNVNSSSYQRHRDIPNHQLAANASTGDEDGATGNTTTVKRGGCADPSLLSGSILDPANIPKKASILMKCRSNPFGSHGGRENVLSWETGAVSECGIRDTNEDAYLIAHDLLEAITASVDGTYSGKGFDSSKGTSQGPMAIWAIFDGHCGNQAARYAAEMLICFLEKELSLRGLDGILRSTRDATESNDLSEGMKAALRDAILKLDNEFCRICHDGGRAWDSGTTALVALLLGTSLIVANLGDCRGVLCRSLDEGSFSNDTEWNQLDAETLLTIPHDLANGIQNRCVWKEIANVHKPADREERARIEKANGWVTTETEIPFGQIRRMDFMDQDVVGILRRGTTVRECKAAPQRILQISRVCGELAVSRALGDRDFKSVFHAKAGQDLSDVGDITGWDCPLLLPYPKDHSRTFHGDLVDNSPDFKQFKISEEGTSEEFLLLASDGLWDVLDVDDAARVTRDLLFRRHFTAKKAAARLAELAIHLGSSDNVTVIVILIKCPVDSNGSSMTMQAA